MNRITVGLADTTIAVTIVDTTIVAVAGPPAVQIIGTDLVGPPGISTTPGPTGPTGATGPTGPTGATGPSDTATKLTVDGNILTRAAGVLDQITRANLAADTAFSSRYMALHPGVILSVAAQVIGNAAANDITFNAEAADVDGWHAAGAVANVVVPAGKDGRYTVCYSGIWALAPGAQSGVSCMINGVTSYEAVLGAGSAWNVSTLTFVRTLVAGDTLKFQAFQASGAARNLTSRLEIF